MSRDRLHVRLIQATLLATLLYLLLTWGAVIAVDIHDLWGLQKVLDDAEGYHYMLWVNLFREAGPTEWLQWALLAGGAGVGLHAWHRTQHAGPRWLAMAWFVLAMGVVLMLLEDSLNIRHVLGEDYFFGTRDGRYLPKAL